MPKINKDSIGKDLRRINRELELEHREKYGDTRPRSKVWDGKPSNKQERRRFKQNLHKMLEGNED